MNQSIPTSQPTHLVVTQTKSVGIAILLTLFLGPIGLFYATIRGALFVMFGVPFLFTVGAIAFGAMASNGSAGGAIGVLAMIPLCMVTMWVLSLVWAVTAVNAYNQRLLGGGR
jgi:hypothetical protein